MLVRSGAESREGESVCGMNDDRDRRWFYDACRLGNIDVEVGLFTGRYLPGLRR